MGEQESQRDYLHRQIAERLTRLDASTVWYRKSHFSGLMTTVVLSASITIFAGLKNSSLLSPEMTGNVVLILGALLTSSRLGRLSSRCESLGTLTIQP